MCSFYIHKPRAAGAAKKVAKGKCTPAKQEGPQAGPSRPRGQQLPTSPILPLREELQHHLRQVRQLVGITESLAMEIRGRLDDWESIMEDLMLSAEDLEFDELDSDG